MRSPSFSSGLDVGYVLPMLQKSPGKRWLEERGDSEYSGNDAHEQHGRGLAGLGLRRRGVHLLVVCDFEAEGLLPMVQMQIVPDVFFE